MASHSRLKKPAEREILGAEVVNARRITPHAVRITIGGEDLRRFQPMGFDQWFRLYIPREGQQGLRRPDRAGLSGYVQYLSMSKAARPVMRNYTVRAFRADSAELDIDVMTHDGAVASAWAGHARPGDPVAILDEGIMYTPSPDVEWTLLVCDESGLPAVAGICDARGEAFLEVPAPDDGQEIDAPVGVHLHWLSRDDPHARPGGLVRAAVAALDPPKGRAYAFVVGESVMVTGLRRFLVTERAMPKEDISFCGYWRYPAAPNSVASPAA
ncbi:siderophore-interacting protein [Candidatus Frankia alpina]|uniref:Siderophore-interacting protein n=1 Tax=Candidatus Frankia alpina TaxID=2699483 RepID=A0A4S5DFE0_9ACTN|nr:siderophore-interacting protein [Candidatus Frankia alpina]THJ56745.1 siderophore-interacting protein [Candidatus Frankia alpina]